MKNQNKILENHVKKAIKDFLNYQGWFHYHNLGGLGSYKGVADRTAIKNGITLWIEVKSPTGKQSPDQVEFEKNIKEKGGHYVLARSVEDVNNYICKNFWDTGVMF